MKISVLSENTAKSEVFSAEHGLSLYIEGRGRKILFDMGQSDNFIVNANALGINLGEVELAFLSHGHYDHGGGIASFLKINDASPIFASPLVFGAHYNGSDKYIGLDKSLRGNPRIRLVEDTALVSEGVTFSSSNEKAPLHAINPFGLQIKKGRKLFPDDFHHESYLIIEEDGRRILFSGCAHRGIINIMEWFKPDVFVGGFHLSKLDDKEELSVLARILSSYPTKYYTCHCTGEAQYNELKTVMKESLSYISTGDILEI